MKIKILVASALLDDGERGGLYEEHDVSDERGQYLIEVGAAEEVKTEKRSNAPKKADEKKAEEPKKAVPAPARKPAPRTK